MGLQANVNNDTIVASTQNKYPRWIYPVLVSKSTDTNGNTVNKYHRLTTGGTAYNPKDRVFIPKIVSEHRAPDTVDEAGALLAYNYALDVKNAFDKMQPGEEVFIPLAGAFGLLLRYNSDQPKDLSVPEEDIQAIARKMLGI